MSHSRCPSFRGTFEPSAGALVGMLVLSTAPRAVISTVAYPLATDSTAQPELTDGLVIGLFNGTWAAGLVLAPLLAGAIKVRPAGPSAAYLAAIVPGVLAATTLALLQRVQARHALQVV